MTSISTVVATQTTTSTASSLSSTTIESQTTQKNADGSVTTITVYEDGTSKTTKTTPDPSKASALTQSDSAGNEKNAVKSDALLSIMV